MRGPARGGWRSVLALAALAAVACGGRQRSGPPRSTCAEAAASITRGLRMAAPEDADGAAALEPRFVAACRTSTWRPTIVRCFALARDPAEHRVCARRLEPGQRVEARLIQSTLYGPASQRPAAAGGVADDSCHRMEPVIEALNGCDRLSPFEQLDLRRAIVLALQQASEASARAARASMVQAGSDCARVADQVRATLIHAGC